MKNWSRIVLVGVLFIVCAASVGAWPTYGSCYVTCGYEMQNQQYYVSAYTYEDCCQATHICPDKNPAIVTVWEPSEGWPMICPPWAE